MSRPGAQGPSQGSTGGVRLAVVGRSMGGVPMWCGVAKWGGYLPVVMCGGCIVVMCDIVMDGLWTDAPQSGSRGDGLRDPQSGP